MSNIFEHFRTFSNISEHFRTFSNVREGEGEVSNIFEHFRTLSNIKGLLDLTRKLRLAPEASPPILSVSSSDLVR